MFGHWAELLIILLVALMVFGPGKLPEVGTALGRAIREFRRATSEIEDAILQDKEPYSYDADYTYPDLELELDDVSQESEIGHPPQSS
jgi:sec-independent protein translocase protein TatA